MHIYSISIWRGEVSLSVGAPVFFASSFFSFLITYFFQTEGYSSPVL
jgi:hypothetical protein